MKFWKFVSAPVAATLWAISLVLQAIAEPPATNELRVAADPNNLPFSNRARQGFDNALAEMVAKDLRRPLRYVWRPERSGFLRNTLKAGWPDLVLGIPEGLPMVRATQPYYRSTYVFVTRLDRHLDIRSFDDPRLASLRIGVHVIGDDDANLPPAQALAKRGIVTNVVGYRVYGDDSRPNPPAALIDAVARGDVDVGVAWGPLAGYFAHRAAAALVVTPIEPGADGPDTPFVFGVAMGVRRQDAALRDSIDSILTRRAPEIDRLLRRYDVPLVAATR
jgi:mxaJ protein